MNSKEWTQKLQLALGITPDGVFGPVTEAKSSAVEIELIVKPLPEVKPRDTDFFGAPWMGSYIHLINREESDKELNQALVPEWAKEGLPNYKTLVGNTHPWCSVFANASMRKVNIKATNNALASSWRTWGQRCDYWFGAVLGLRHASGGGHVTFFAYWVDEANKIAACYGGNQGNHLRVSIYNLSGNSKGKEDVVNGPRWPIGFHEGQKVSKAQVLAKYPMLAPGGTGGSTR